MENNSFKLGYIPELDGLRAIAVLLVMMAHSNYKFGDNGGVGVDIFFALSGYLITTLIFEEKSRFGYFNYKFFYLRRFYRLFPALFLLLFFTSLLVFFLFKASWDIYFKELISSFIYVYNISWYWGWLDKSLFLYHMWSLGVEEQYYLYWPFLILFFVKFIKKKYLGYFLLILSILIFSFRFYLNKFLFFNSIFMDSIFFGSILGIIFRDRGLRFLINSYVLNFSFLFIILFSTYNFLFISKLLSYGYRGIFGFFSCLIILNLVLDNKDSLIRKFLSNGSLIFVGKISYSLYLWHNVVFIFFRKTDYFEGYQRFILKFLISFVLAILSYFLVEKPILKISKRRYSTS